MVIWTMRYDFRQPFRAPAAAAYDWCTDFQPDDLPRMGQQGVRRVRWLSDTVVLLRDRFQSASGSVIKEKLVHLLPDRLSWTSTHIVGPTRYSQFLYTIQPRGRAGSALAFTGLQVEQRDSRPTPSRRARAARKLRDEDSAGWRQLAEALESDVNE